eukprot:Hpha_TRINITY_DN19952_c0_g1::TRINITY_DN19952_c0_g1_i1::g.93504::m.93504
MPGNVSSPVGYLNPELVRGWGREDYVDRALEINMGSSKDFKKATTKRTVMFHDVRAGPPVTLDRNGVELVKLPSKCTDFRNLDGQVKQVLFPEVVEMCKRLTGAAHASVHDYLVRSENPMREAKSSGLGVFTHMYSRFVHVDGAVSTVDAFRERIPGQMGISKEACSPRNMDICTVNVWKPIERPVTQNPLGVIDGSTIQTTDVVQTMFTGYGGNKLSQLLPNENHRWLYWPQMQTDEALVFKQVDTRDVPAKHGFHTSFEDPSAPKGAPGRRSVELRVLLCFPRKAPRAAL